MIGRAHRAPAFPPVGTVVQRPRWSALVFFTLLASVFSARAQPYAIHWKAEGQPAVEVAGFTAERIGLLQEKPLLPVEWQRLLAVFAEQRGEASAGSVAMPPMAGSWSIVGERLRFVPLFPFSRGVRYRAEFRLAGEAPLVAFFELPADPVFPTTVVAQIFPSSNRLPENQLKFYVQFSAPMSRGGIYENIRLRDAQGVAIELPFLELDEELWDPTMTRLTLLIDPGRIKRGVKPLEEAGPVFEAGKNYSLTIDAACRDAAGHPLRAALEKTFQIVAADRTPPDPARWKLLAPPAGTRDPLVVEFDEPMDQALALRLIGVFAEERGTSLALNGASALGGQERQWSFVPIEPWRSGAYQLKVHNTIEDLAGNNIGKAFDVDASEEKQPRFASEMATVPFVVR